MAIPALLQSWLNFSRANTGLQQFGQSGDASTWNGATGCTHTCLQRLIKAQTGRTVSHDTISKVAGYPWPNHNAKKRGLLSPSEVGRVIAYYKLPYKYLPRASWAQVGAAMELGPVMVGIRYGYWPEKVGYRYQGSTADGRPGGFAFRNGKTQLKGFESGYHAILLLGQYRDANGVYRVSANEPNHGSSSRPEKPDYDDVRAQYAARAYEKYGSTGRPLLAWVPTRTFKPKGY
jgi:hypothetical protein